MTTEVPISTYTTPNATPDGSTSPFPVEPAQWARALWSAAEPFTLGAYFTPEAAAAPEAVGLPGRSAFIPLRAAPLGDASPAVVTAAFRGFPLTTIAAVITAARPVFPADVAIEAMHRAVPLFVARALPELSDDARVDVVADDLETAIAALDTTGRPLAAGGQAITAAGSSLAPTTPWARLWRAANTLREYRGDGHIAALTAAGLARVHADVLTAAWAGTQIDVAGLRATRSLDDATWDAAAADLTGQGLLDPDGTITATGRELRDRIETATDAASAPPWALLGPERSQAAWDLFAAASAALIQNGAMRGTTPVGSPWPPVPLVTATATS